MRQTYHHAHILWEWHYYVVFERCYHIELGLFTTYGIHLAGPHGEETLHDVSVSKETVTWMAELFNRHKLLPCHFRDAVEDFLP